MSTKCPECSNRFTLQEALCGDWKDPNKSFGCPHCGTFFVKDMRPNMKISLVSSLFMAGILLPAINILIRNIISIGDNAITAYGSFIIFFSVIIAFLSTPSKLFGPLKKSPHTRMTKSDSESYESC
jgi:hypothetical protein